MTNYVQRIQYKDFGQNITAQYYVGKEKLFPNKFTGYHAAVDLETLPGEENQPVAVMAIGEGKILYLGPVAGYGGLILEKLDKSPDTALYGHVKLSSTKFKAGDQVAVGQTLVYLGDAFSGETGGEHKHLHFGIYSGSDLYFRGYEQTLAQLNARWINPTKFLADRISIPPTPTTPTSQSKPQLSLWQIILRFFHLRG